MDRPRKTLIDRLAEERLQTVRPGDEIVTNDGATRYRTISHLNGVQQVRKIPKVRGKKARAADKLARRRFREALARGHS